MNRFSRLIVMMVIFPVALFVLFALTGCAAESNNGRDDAVVDPLPDPPPGDDGDGDGDDPPPDPPPGDDGDGDGDDPPPDPPPGDDGDGDGDDPPPDPPPVSETGALLVTINPDDSNPDREWHRVKVTGTGLPEPLFVDTDPSVTSIFIDAVPTGPVTIGGTAWKDRLNATGPNGDFGPVMLSYDGVVVEVAPCASPCDTPTSAIITLAPSNAVVTSPSGFVYGSDEPQEISVQISYTNYPLGLRKAGIRAYITDYPVSDTVFENLCTENQVPTDTTVRECVGTLQSTAAIMALLPGSVRAFVLVEGYAYCRDFQDGNGCTLLPESSNFGFRDFVLISDPLPAAP